MIILVDCSDDSKFKIIFNIPYKKLFFEKRFKTILSRKPFLSRHSPLLIFYLSLYSYSYVDGGKFCCHCQWLSYQHHGMLKFFCWKSAQWRTGFKIMLYHHSCRWTPTTTPSPPHLPRQGSSVAPRGAEEEDEDDLLGEEGEGVEAVPHLMEATPGSTVQLPCKLQVFYSIFYGKQLFVCNCKSLKWIAKYSGNPSPWVFSFSFF